MQPHNSVGGGRAPTNAVSPNDTSMRGLTGSNVKEEPANSPNYHSESLDPKRNETNSIGSDDARKTRMTAYPLSGDSDETQTSNASGDKKYATTATSSTSKSPANGNGTGSKDTSGSKVKIKILNLDAWQLTYVRTRNNSLRCFPACRPVHRERSFCGLPVLVNVDSRSENESKQMVVLGSFRKVKTDVIKIGDRFSTVELTRMLGSDFIIGTFLAFDKRTKQAKYKLGPPRKWRYVANTLSSTEMHTFTVYVFTQAGGKCMARQDSPFFTIVPAWRQSATEITARIQASSDSDTRSVEQSKDTKQSPAPRNPQNPSAVGTPPEYRSPHPMPYPPRPPFHGYEAQRWENGNAQKAGGARKRSRVANSAEQDSSHATAQQSYYGYSPHMGMPSSAMYNPYAHDARGIPEEGYGAWAPGMHMVYPAYAQQWAANPYMQGPYAVPYDWNSGRQRPNRTESDSQDSGSSSDTSGRSQSQGKAKKKTKNGNVAARPSEGYYPMQQHAMPYPFPGYYHPPPMGQGQYPIPPERSAHGYPPAGGYESFQNKPS